MGPHPLHPPFLRGDRPWKGKARADHPIVIARQDGSDSDGRHGALLPLKLVGTTLYDAIYTVSILVGPNKQNFSVQVDSGSSDLWLTSTSCSQSSCAAATRKYDSQYSTPTGKNFVIQYVQGEVTGPIVWDTVQIGNYVIQRQALSAATRVDDEPLSSDFSGILGLALPLNSFISEQIPPVLGDTPDGAAFASNLFGMTPIDIAPSSRFFSLSLGRSGSSKVPSLLGIGMHPPSIIQDPAKILYSNVVMEPSGAYFWKANVKGITVYQAGVRKPVEVKSSRGSQFATGVVDSGMPIILTTVDIANGIYGALGIGPASDGQYYVPCDVPLNMTITLDDRPEIPLHPLDLTTTTPSSSSATATCMGVIQSFPPGSTVGLLADVVLGVPFMRSTYTVMAYDPPDSQGRFPNSAASPSSAAYIRPRLGLLSLTDPTQALEEFNRVRVLNQPLDQNPNTVQPDGGVHGATSIGGKKLSIGVIVLISLLGFFALCLTLFGIRWLYARRKYGAVPKEKSEGEKNEDTLMKEVAYRLARRSSRSDPYGPSEDTLRRIRYEEYRRKTDSSYTQDTDRTRVSGIDEGKEKDPDGDISYQEFGYRPTRTHDRGDSIPFSPDSEGFDPYTLVPAGDITSGGYDTTLVASHSFTPGSPVSDSTRGRPHERTSSGEPGVAAPLLAHTRSESNLSRAEESPVRHSPHAFRSSRLRCSLSMQDMLDPTQQDPVDLVGSPLVPTLPPPPPLSQRSSRASSPLRARFSPPPHPPSHSPIPPPAGQLSTIHSSVSLNDSTPHATSGHSS